MTRPIDQDNVDRMGRAALKHAQVVNVRGMSTSSRRQPQSPQKQPLTFKQIVRKTVNAMVVAANVIVALGLLASGYAHWIAPSKWPFSVLIAMSFPFWLAAIVVLLVLDLKWWKRTAWIAGIAMVACFSPIKEYAPLNLPHFLSKEEKERTFTLMTWNVLAFDDQEQKAKDSNRQLEYILEKQPDIVCIQEAERLTKTKANHITGKQLDKINEIYPWVLTQDHDFAILSKYDCTPINLNFPRGKFESGDMAAWRVKIDGKVINIFSVHLRSLSLTRANKGAYTDIVKMESVSRSDLRDARNSIMPKLEKAGVEREKQVEYLLRYLSKYGGKTAIVCGDFNDTVGAHCLYMLERDGHMRQAYEDCGFGPMYTYNANLMFFRIDHVLYRGDVEPVKMSKGRIKCSDHYPLTTTFLIENTKK